MGVRGLQTFLEQHCPEACYSVDIAKLVRDYQSNTGKQAEIVIDAQSCYNYWCKGIDWIIGFEIQEFIHRLQSFVNAFNSIGAKLVFFFGGLTPEKKREVWLTRRIKNLKEVFTIFDFLAEGNSPKDIPKQFNSIPPNMGFTTSLILKYLLKCEVYMTIEECDEEIIQYAEKHESFAIFGQDTDFIISDLKSIVLSSKNFDMLSMTTLLYDRAELARCLGIEVRQFPLLAILAGNDFIHFDSIRDFHIDLCNSKNDKYIPFQILMPAIGRYINTLPQVDIDKLLDIISNMLFKSSSKIDLLKMVYNSYIIHPPPNRSPPNDKWSQILQIARYRHMNVIVPSTIWSIISDHVFECSVAFEDLRRIKDDNERSYRKPSATITRVMRQRLYGILLHEYGDPSVVVKEWCGENYNSYKEPVEVIPKPPTVHHPGLLALWSDDNGDRLCNMRLNLFLNAISPYIRNTKEWAALEEDELISTASLYYLYDTRYFNKSELFAILATLVTYPLYNRQKLESLSYGKVDNRAIQLSVTFIRTFGFVTMLLAACGYPIPMSANIASMKFEGKLFQIKYNQSVNEKKKAIDLCENDKFCINSLYRMKAIICKDLLTASKKDNPAKLKRNRGEEGRVPVVVSRVPVANR